MQTYIENVRQHSVAGAFGGTVSGATNATPIVVSTSAAHGLIDGDQIQVTGVGGNTNANTLAYAKVTGYSTTTFGMFSDTALSVGIAGNASYTSGGAVSEAHDISGLSGDFTLKMVISGLAAGARALVSVQDSTDGFVNDVKTLWSVNVEGGSSSPAQYFSIRSYELESTRIGVTNARLRLYVQVLDSGTVTTSLLIEQ